MGGEQGILFPQTPGRFGSSPHGRGTAECAGHARRGWRFIPAWAGNSWQNSATILEKTVHPRMGGEQKPNVGRESPSDGSSPHGRGTVEDMNTARCCDRFIPAWAGNSSRRYRKAARMPVHPRMGGEQDRPKVQKPRTVGSSPHGRGTERRPCDSGCPLRFIPAWAGTSQ